MVHNNVNVAVRVQTRERLEKLKIHSRQPLNEVITTLLDEKDESEPKKLSIFELQGIKKS